MNKKTITIVSIIVGTIILLAIIGTIPSNKFGAVSNEGEYKVLTTGQNQVVSYNKAVLHKVQLSSGDIIIVGDSASSATTNTVFKMTAGATGVYELDAIFNTGITVSVTSSNGAVFIFSRQ